jgi:hypothetical protein
VTSPAQQSASAILRDTLNQWGIGELYNDALSLMKQGLDDNAILIQLQNTDAYKRRFAGNEARRKAGLSVLSPAEYVSTETAYKDVLRQNGLPAGFYDKSDDLTKFIAADVSPSELQDRAQIAQRVWLNGNEDYKSIWTDFYGLSAGDAIASILDPGTAEPLIQKKLTATQIGAAAKRQGIGVDRSRAEFFAANGIDESAAQQGYAAVAGELADTQNIATRFGQTFTQTDAENSEILNLASAQRKKKDLFNDEASLFAQKSGANQQSLSKSTAGSY